MQRRKRPAIALVLIAALLVLTLGCSRSVQARGWAPPVKSNNVLMVSTGHGHLDGIDASTQKKLWRFPDDWSLDRNAKTLQGIYGAPITSSDGKTVYVGDYNGYVYAFRPGDVTANPSEKPRAGAVKLTGSVLGGLALTNDGTLYATASSRIYKISATDLERKIDNKDVKVEPTVLFKAGNDIWSTPLSMGGSLIFASLDGNMYAIDPATGRENWRYSGTRALASTPVVASGTLLVGGFDSKLHAVDAATGNQRWEFSADDWIWSAPAIDGGRAYIGDFAGNVYGLNLSDGSKVWSSKVADGPIVGSPVVAGGALVVASERGEIFGLDPSTQQARWQPQDLGTALAADLVADSSTVYLAPSGCVTRDGETAKTYYISLNAQTGQLTTANEVCPK